MTQLRAAGITGIVFIELDRRNPERPVLLPLPQEDEDRYPVIASQLSQAKQMLTSVDQIMGRIEQVDFKGISDQVKADLAGDGDLPLRAEMNGILKNLDSTTASLEQPPADRPDPGGGKGTGDHG